MELYLHSLMHFRTELFGLAVTVEICYREVLCSNTGRDIGYLE
jgi:hypothetical protein